MKHVSVIICITSILSSFSTEEVYSQQIEHGEIEKAFDLIAMRYGLGPMDPGVLKGKVEAIGGIEFELEVPIDFMSRKELALYIQKLIEEEYPRKVALRDKRVLQFFGFLRKEDDLRKIRERVLNENVAGFYDERPGVKKLFAISSTEKLNFLNQIIMSHELRHAAQDQYVGIREKLGDWSDYDDRSIAALSLFEGDALIVMKNFVQDIANQVPELALFSEALTSSTDLANQHAGPALSAAPAVVQEQLVAPYLHGQKLAAAIYKKGGFALLNKSLLQPPRSTEQVLHPNKYLTSPTDEPILVEMPRTRGRDVDSEGRLGELLIRTLLTPVVGTPMAIAAAAGWGGDAYAVTYGDAGYTLIWKSLWDTPEDMKEFESMIRRYAAMRFEGDYTITANGVEVFLTRTGLN